MHHINPGSHAQSHREIHNQEITIQKGDKETITGEITIHFTTLTGNNNTNNPLSMQEEVKIAHTTIPKKTTGHRICEDTNMMTTSTMTTTTEITTRITIEGTGIDGNWESPNNDNLCNKNTENNVITKILGLNVCGL